ncbi:MAG TPA: 16S rRNA (guanine(966)-N(2))-methyltransferase RsmD, partial [Limnobacter sp.]|nr:16S rRNA (guanine(966)-N(2))-methyltransferase RsmD [Limnobacter sp.]
MNKQANKLRIIGGAWRRHLLPIAPVEGLRPTPDRVRETVFNWLGQDCTGMQVLDLYAGTGALGFEAASRGASNVVLVEQNRQVVAQLQENKS